MGLPTLAAADHSPMRFDIASDYAAGREVQQRIMDAVECSGFSEPEVFGIKLSLEEALINSIKHGNKLDPQKRVKVECTVKSKFFEISIQDEGAGFEREKVPDPTAEENLTKCSGRGLLLMEAYMDEVKYSDRGRKIYMRKKG
jgi:serine/threonine-protein kinase RsbW